MRIVEVMLPDAPAHEIINGVQEITELAYAGRENDRFLFVGDMSQALNAVDVLPAEYQTYILPLN